MDPVVPDKVWSRSFPRGEEIRELIEELERRGASLTTKNIFKTLACLRPDLRLAVNLKNLLGMNVLHEVENVLAEGLGPGEREALIELDKLDMPLRLKEVAHGLLSVHERWMLIKAMGRAFKEARNNRPHFLDSEAPTTEMENILGI
jgi:hypothetical protein